MSEVKEVPKKYLMDLQTGRYELVKLTKEWLSVFQKTDDAKGMSPSEMVKRALEDVSSGVISPEDVKRIKSKTKSAPVVEQEPKMESLEEEKVKKPKKDAKTKK